ncbi:ASCH domain-containing protein [Planctomicrobium sp. SH664]|uniref:ASCH domain-containing protein n=1 Tax=Planctomicrobium sp. SH664 TaxID=3448125 RepID=UPI003F5B1875
MSTQELTVLSVRQPWASLLLTGEDWCENRSWDTRYRGPLWIHASGKVDAEECRFFGIDKKSLTTSSILGCVELVDVFHIDELAKRLKPLVSKYELNDAVGPHFVVGDFCWIVANPRVLASPIPCGGKLNLWKTTVEEHLVQEMVSSQPLIKPEFYPESATIEDAQIMVDGKGEEISFIIKDWISIYFPDRDETLEAAFPDEDAYLTGLPHFRAACEKAWELFPDDFLPDVQESLLRTGANNDS